jgi:hypothetical protein
MAVPLSMKSKMSPDAVDRVVTVVAACDSQGIECHLGRNILLECTLYQHRVKLKRRLTELVLP